MCSREDSRACGFCLSLQKYIRALRLPFISASILPFILGSFIDKQSFLLGKFLIGLMAVVSTHLGANLLNDYADSKSGVDWQDRKWYTFFGGSKLIQEGELSEKFYFYAAMICFAIAAVCILMLSLFLRNFSIIGFYALILFLGFSYSHKPLAFSYHRLGELIIFVLFGPALVMGGYFIQTQIFPDLRSFMLSLPFGFFTTAILYSNEIPDFQDDRRMGKYTWVGILGKERSYIIYCLLIFLGFLCIGLNIILGYLGVLSLIALVFIAPSFKAVNIIKTFYNQKEKLIESSRITIIIQSLVSLILVLDIIR